MFGWGNQTGSNILGSEIPTHDRQIYWCRNTPSFTVMVTGWWRVFWPNESPVGLDDSLEFCPGLSRYLIPLIFINIPNTYLSGTPRPYLGSELLVELPGEPRVRRRAQLDGWGTPTAARVESSSPRPWLKPSGWDESGGTEGCLYVFLQVFFSNCRFLPQYMFGCLWHGE